MAKGQPVTAEQRARARVLHAEGKGRNEIAREIGLSTAAVTHIINDAGLSFERSATAAATEARVIDLKARRVAIVERQYKRVEFLQTRLEAAKFKTLVKSAGGAEFVDELDFVPTPNERDLAQSISIHLTAAEKLAALDSDNGTGDAKSLLLELGKALGVAGPETA